MEKNTSIKAVVFDLGGVLFTNGTKNTIKHINEKYAVNTDELIDIFYGDLSWKLRKGSITYRNFWDAIYTSHAEFYNLVEHYAEDYWHNSYQINQGLLSIITYLKQDHIIGLISGNISERISFLENKYDFNKYFDFKVYSFEFGDDKLNDTLYVKAAEDLSRYGIEPHESLYIDDNLDCTEAAKKLGFNTYLFTDVSSFSKDVDLQAVKEGSTL